MAGPATELDSSYVPPAFTGRQQWLAVFLFAFSNFMVMLDLTIANVSVPHIAGDLGITMDQGTWIITSYAVAEAICVPLTGWLAIRFGVTPVFVGAMVGFGIFSLLCGIAPTLGVLVAARIGQGLFGAPMMPMSQTLMMIVIPPENRGKMMGIWAMTTMTAPAFGPIIGGWISDTWSWHWIFLINVPIAAMLAAISWVILRPVRTPTARQPIDKVGLGLLIFWIGTLQLMLDTGRDHDWFGDTRIVLLAAAAAIGFIAFVIWELTEEHPIVDLRVFRHVGFSSSLWAMTAGFGAFFSGNVIVPQWLQGTMGFSAQTAGLITGTTAIASIMVAAFVSRLVYKVDPRLLVTFGLLWAGATTLLRAGWTTGETWYHYALPIFLTGFGMPFFFMPLSILSLNAVERREVASAAGLQAFARTMSIALATSVALTIWGNGQRRAHSEIADVLNPDATQATLGQVGMGIDAARGYINALVDQQAITLAMNHTTIIAALMMMTAGLAVWIGPRPDVGPAAKPS